ncbi:MAG: B12-binding domain-containing radical SAM protein [Candidatus Omnitrophota bacterium]
MNDKMLLVMMPPFWPKTPPIGLGYLQAYLEENGIRCGILDANRLFYGLSSDELKKSWLVSCNSSLEKSMPATLEKLFPEEYAAVIEKIARHEIVGLSCFKSNFRSSLELARILKSKNKNIKIILGGPETARQFFKKGLGFMKEISGLINLAVIGEGERPLLDYARGRINGNNALFRELPDLTAPLFPRYRGIDLASYPGKGAMPVIFSRGCVRHCSFCSERLLYKKFRVRPSENVIDEMTYHKSENKTERFVFHDSLLNGDLKKLEALCDAMTKNFGSVKWEAQMAIRNDMSPELLKEIKESGCYNLFVGLESGCDRTLRNMRKSFSAEDAVNFFKKLNDAGLFFGISVIVGYPGETEKDFKDSLGFIMKNKGLIPKIEQINPFTYYDGTDADKTADYSINKDSMKRMDILIKEVKSGGFRYTNAFLGNLVEK